MSQFNWESLKTFWFVNQENKMMLTQNPGWDLNGDNGKGDSIGRSWLSYYTYGDQRFIEGIEKCWVKTPRKTWLGRLLKGKYYYQGYRYPAYANGTEEQPIGFSRDHTLNTLLAYKYAGKSNKEIWEFVKHLKFRISPFALHTIDLWLWERVISGRKIAPIFYYPIAWCVTAITAWWQLKVQKFTGIGPDYEIHQNEFKHMQNKDKPIIIKKSCIVLYPTFTMAQTGWQFKFLPNKWWRERIQKQMRKIIPKYNYAIKLLYNDKSVTKEDVYGYESMKGSRWTGNLNKWWNDRELVKIKDSKLLEYNVLDVDYIRKLWEDFGN